MNQEKKKRLERTLHQEVPLTRHMGVHVRDYDGLELVTTAELLPNINIHGTAFGGSLYSICAVTCWGLLHLKLEEVGLAAHSVLADARVNYRYPVKKDIEARCRLPDEVEFEAYLRKVRNEGRARIELTAEVATEQGTAMRFSAVYSTFTESARKAPSC